MAELNNVTTTSGTGAASRAGALDGPEAIPDVGAGASGNGLVIGSVYAHSLPADVQTELANAYNAWAQAMIPPHEEWHMTNGSGGTQGPTSGDKFIKFHEGMMAQFRDHLNTIASDALRAALEVDGVLTLPKLDFTQQIPGPFAYDTMEKNTIDFTPPVYVQTRAKGGANGEDFRLQVVDEDGNSTTKTVTCLDDIEDIDQLGRVLGESGLHAVGHVELGGQMGSFDSVGVAPFMLWHGWVIDVTQEWLGTANGQAWLKAQGGDGAADGAMAEMASMRAMDGMDHSAHNEMSDLADSSRELEEKITIALANFRDAEANGNTAQANLIKEGIDALQAKKDAMDLRDANSDAPGALSTLRDQLEQLDDDQRDLLVAEAFSVAENEKEEFETALAETWKDEAAQVLGSVGTSVSGADAE